MPADSAPLRLSTVSEVIALLENTINNVRDGHINAKDANTIGYLSGILLKALEQGRVEERLTALEQIINTQTPAESDLEFLNEGLNDES